MYKLLLVTDRDEVVHAFHAVLKPGDMMFAPLTVIREPHAAIEYLERNAVDAAGYSFSGQDSAALHQYLAETRPSLPIFQTHHQGETLRNEMNRLRRFLDSLHADFADEAYDEDAMLAYLRDELMHQLLAHQIGSPEELMTRLKLVRANLAMDRKSFLFDFDMPQGEVYLGGRWHYGRERLEKALRNHFFGRYVENIFYGVAVLGPRHIRVLASQRHDTPEEDLNELMPRVEEQMQKSIAEIKEYLDLDLNLERYSVLESLGDITGISPQPYEEEDNDI